MLPLSISHTPSTSVILLKLSPSHQRRLFAIRHCCRSLPVSPLSPQHYLYCPHCHASLRRQNITIPPLYSSRHYTNGSINNRGIEINNTGGLTYRSNIIATQRNMVNNGIYEICCYSRRHPAASCRIGYRLHGWGNALPRFTIYLIGDNIDIIRQLYCLQLPRRRRCGNNVSTPS